MQKWMKDFKNSVKCPHCQQQPNWENYKESQDSFIYQNRWCPSCQKKVYDDKDMNKSDLMNGYIDFMREQALRMFPDAVSVEIFITHEEVDVKPVYCGSRAETSMIKIDGTWCTKRDT